MEIEIGEYVRTKDGYIAKAVERDTTNWLFFDNSIMEICSDRFITLNPLEQKERVIAHSKNIIDLIEKGDVIDYYSNYLGTYIKAEVVNVINEKEDYEWGKGYCSTCIDEHIRIPKIKTILTKEQYEAGCVEKVEE